MFYRLIELVDPTCQLCLSEAEDRTHFVLRCKELETSRSFYIEKLKCYLRSHYTAEPVDALFNDEQSLFQLIMDSTHPNLNDFSDGSLDQHSWMIEPVTRSLCYSLYTKWSALLLDANRQQK